jgi:hypothetical protein
VADFIPEYVGQYWTEQEVSKTTATKSKNFIVVVVKKWRKKELLAAISASSLSD